MVGSAMKAMIVGYQMRPKKDKAGKLVEPPDFYCALAVVRLKDDAEEGFKGHQVEQINCSVDIARLLERDFRSGGFPVANVDLDVRTWGGANAGSMKMVTDYELLGIFGTDFGLDGTRFVSGVPAPRGPVVQGNGGVPGVAARSAVQRPAAAGA
jgi:hypothetical protein